VNRSLTTGKLEFPKQFTRIVIAVALVTFSQGLVIPLLASLQIGLIPSVVNSISTTVLYMGLVIAMFLVEKLVRRLGMRNTVLWSLGMGIVMVLLFSLTRNAWMWLVCRFGFGLCLGAIHYTTQTWLGQLTDSERRGRQMALYGMATGVGFAIGPLCLITASLSPMIPFVLIGLALTIAVFLITRLPNPGMSLANEESTQGIDKPAIRQLYRMALPAIAMPFVFGYMESALNGDLPLYAERVGLPVTVISTGLAAFVIGSLVLQYALGHLSDRWGRGRILVGCSAIGALVFGLLPFIRSAIGFALLLALAGGFVGTLFSLSLAFLHDLVGHEQLARANRLAMVHFGTGMSIGTFVAGLAMAWIGPWCLFWSISLLYVGYIVIRWMIGRRAYVTGETASTGLYIKK
jgi:MFS family permease